MEDCGGNLIVDNIFGKSQSIVLRYSGGMEGRKGSSPVFDPNYTFDAFKTDMNALLTSPELINCPDYYYGPDDTPDWYQGPDDRALVGPTIAYQIAQVGSVELAKWVVSKGADLTIRHYNLGITAQEHASAIGTDTQQLSYINRTATEYLQTAEILKPPVSPATKSCAEVDGLYYIPNEYCFVAENTQESFASRLLIPIFDGYQHVTTAKASGIGFFKDWRSTITFDCRAPAGKICGPLDYTVDDSWPEEHAQQVKDDFGLYIRCDDSINLLDVDTIEAGKSVSIDMHQGWVNYPYSNSCKAHSSNPFTLSIKTTRLAQ